MDKKGKEIVKTLESKAKLLSNEKIVRFLQKSIRAEDETRIIVLDKEIQERMKPLEPRSKRKNNYNVCVECGQNVDIREASLFSGMVITLIRIEKWCKENDRHEFIRKEIEHLLDKNTKARFGDWVYFGGLIYSRGKGKWGMNLDRTEQFVCPH